MGGLVKRWGLFYCGDCDISGERSSEVGIEVECLDDRLKRMFLVWALIFGQKG